MQVTSIVQYKEGVQPQRRRGMVGLVRVQWEKGTVLFDFGSETSLNPEDVVAIEADSLCWLSPEMGPVLHRHLCARPNAWSGASAAALLRRVGVLWQASSASPERREHRRTGQCGHQWPRQQYLPD